MKTISVSQWTGYLNKKTGGFSCPICGQQHWETQPDYQNNVCDIELLDHSSIDEFCDMIGGWILENGGESPDHSDEPPRRPPSLLRHLFVLRCGHCGWVAMFDRKFVEEGIFNDKEDAEG